MKYFFITGTGRGIGKALCELLLKNTNHFVFGFSRSEITFPVNYQHTILDLAKPENVEKFQFPELNQAEQIVLINNAATLGEIRHIGNLTSKIITTSYNVNIISPGVLMNSFVRAYKDLTVPRMIINIGSGAGRHPVESWSTYCASKSALDMISEVFRTEQNLLPFENQIRIHSLAPGIVDTRMQEEIRAVDSADFSDKERFVMYKEKNQLSSAERVCRYIADIMENPDKYGETLLDVRKINL